MVGLPADLEWTLLEKETEKNNNILIMEKRGASDVCSEGPNQSVHLSGLIRAFAVHQYDDNLLFYVPFNIICHT